MLPKDPFLKDRSSEETTAVFGEGLGTPRIRESNPTLRAVTNTDGGSCGI